jgi:hypothetical protein
MSGILLAAAVLCGAAKSHPVTLDERANGSVVRVARGTSVSVVLHSNYWDIRGSSRPWVLGQRGPAEALAGSCPPGVGCGELRATFIARHLGTAVITATRTVCGEAMQCAPDQRCYRITVVVIAPPGTERSSGRWASSRSR